MAEQNFNKVIGIFGQRSTGKTLYIKGSEKFNLPGFFNSYLNKGMKVLIIDTIDHPSYRDIEIIKAEDLNRWKKGVYRIFVRVEEMPILNSYINSLVNLWNTLIVYEDAYKHQKNRLDKSIVELIIDSKQKNIDIVFMFHAWAMPPNDLYRMIDLIEVFKTKDSPIVKKIHMPGYFEEALKTYEEVKNNESRYYHKTINTDL